MLAPALQSGWSEIGVWPFQGDLPALMRNCSCVVVETYPAEACVQVGLAAPGRGWSKRNQRHRASHHVRLMQWIAKMPVRLSTSFEATLQDGFGHLSDGEDRFDATVGLFALLEVVLGHRPDGAPTDQTIRNVEGWICGQIDARSAGESRLSCL